MLSSRATKFVMFVLLVAGITAVSACTTILDVDFDAPHLAPSSELAANTKSCKPKTCGDQGFACGTQNDGCGNAIECGNCNGGPCFDGKCTCTPKTCPELNAKCGVVDNGCGQTLNCGACANATDACVNNKCECKPKDCNVQAANCGQIPDGCGNTYTCGACDTAGTTPHCGGDGPNKCGATPCVPKTCAGRCGQFSDGCGTVLNCGGCNAPLVCGGGGVANSCGCTPTSCAQQGKNCGTIPDGCNGTLDCMGCSPPNSCGGGGVPNVCGCTPTGACGGGTNCGTVPNGCGGNVSCGPACTAPNSCGGGGQANVCGCSPTTCDDFICGNHPNGCGGTLYCGFCGGCFPSGTQVTMADGSLKPIQAVTLGDWVRTRDPSTGVLSTRQVLELKSHASKQSLPGIIAIAGGLGAGEAPNMKDTKLRATRNHPITANGRIVTMDQVHVGDEITTSDNLGRVMTTKVATVALEVGGVVTYDLVLATPGTGLAEADTDHVQYFANGVAVQLKPVQP